MKDFDKAVKFTLLREGFISDDPQDTGGLTIFGISSKWYPKEIAYLKELINEGEIKKAKEYAINFYYSEFWVKSGCMVLIFPMSLVVFDTAVNCGRSKAKEIFRKCSDDWRYYLLSRIVFNTHCETEETHLRGWTKRIAKLYEYINE